jgi:hypothetical protein
MFYRLLRISLAWNLNIAIAELKTAKRTSRTTSIPDSLSRHLKEHEAPPSTVILEYRTVLTDWTEVKVEDTKKQIEDTTMEIKDDYKAHFVELNQLKARLALQA